MSREDWIDSLKGIAICGVILIHSGTSALPSFWAKGGEIGQKGVYLFLIISTFLTFRSLEQVYNRDNRKVRIKCWIIKKFLYLIPLYYLALAIGIVRGGQPFWLGSEGYITVYNIVAHMIFIHGFFPHYVDSMIGVEWYLGVLSIFYILASVLYKWIDSLKKSIIFSAACIILCFVLTQILEKNMPKTEDTYIYISYFTSFSFFAQLPVIALGITTFYVLKIQYFLYIKRNKLISNILLIFSILLMVIQTTYGISNVSTWGFCFMIVVISQSINANPLINNRLFQVLGRHSYPMYLFHIFWIYLYERYVMWSTGNDILDCIIKYMIIVVIVLLSAFPLEKFIDISFRNKVKTFGER